jgi:multicomponent Na+:H+ antiporter subunit F
MNFEQALAVVLALLLVAACIIVGRILRPGTLADRVVAFDSLASIIICGLLVDAARSNDGVRLDLAVVLGLLGFLASVTVARFIELREGQDS